MTRPLLSLALLILPLAAEEDSPSAFRYRTDPKVKSAIDKKEILQGIPGQNPRDKIPAIRDPKHVPAKEATWIRPDERVLGVVVDQQARAYPLDVLESHEMVNDRLGDVPIAPNY